MAWSEKAIEAVLFEFDLDIEDEVNKANAQRALDAAAVVDGDAQREALAQFMIKQSFPTGHGDTHADLLAELDAAIQGSGDAQWDAAIEAAAQKAGAEFCGAFEGIGDDTASTIRSLKRQK